MGKGCFYRNNNHTRAAWPQGASRPITCIPHTYKRWKKGQHTRPGLKCTLHALGPKSESSQSLETLGPPEQPSWALALSPFALKDAVVRVREDFEGLDRKSVYHGSCSYSTPPFSPSDHHPSNGPSRGGGGPEYLLMLATPPSPPPTPFTQLHTTTASFTWRSRVDSPERACMGTRARAGCGG